jgi:acetyl esterase
MPVTAQTRTILDAIAGMPPLETLSVAEGRAQARQRAGSQPASPEVDRVVDTDFAGPAGRVPLRLYYPLADAPLPILMFFHGSGFVVADLDTHDGLCRHLCAASRALVISVDYRLAPEAPFPAAPDDCLAATLWARDEAGRLGADASAIATCGDSAGGNLAAVVALDLRDRGVPLSGQVLLYPVTDAPDPSRASYRENGRGHGLTAEGMAWYWQHYLGGRTPCGRAAPMRATNLSNVAPALVITAEFDVLRDEGRAYAERLEQAGVSVDYECVPGVIHAFASMLGHVPEAEAAVARVGAWLRARFAQSRSPGHGG